VNPCDKECGSRRATNDRYLPKEFNPWLVAPQSLQPPKEFSLPGFGWGREPTKPVLTRRTLSGLLGPDRTRLWRPTKIHIQRRSLTRPRSVADSGALNAPAQSARLFDTAATFARVFPANKCALLGRRAFVGQSSSQTAATMQKRGAGDVGPFESSTSRAGT
jgi:hypothetical protein